MKKLIETLRTLGIEVPEDKEAEVKKKLSEHYKNVAEIEKTTNSLETDRNTWKKRAETAEGTLKKFEGIDPEKVQAELADWKKKAEDAEKDYAAKIKERDIRDKVNERLLGVKMKDDMKDFIYDEILKTGVDLNRNGDLIGFDEGLKTVQEKRPSAFVNEQQENLEQHRARFTQPLNQRSQPEIKPEIKPVPLVW